MMAAGRGIRAILTVGVLVVATQIANAALRIEITEGVTGARPVAVVPFAWQGGAAEPPLDVAGVVDADLSRTGRFAITTDEGLPARPSRPEDIDFRAWREAGFDNLVIGRLEASGEGYELWFYLFDVLRARQLTAMRIPVAADELRRAAHGVSDRVYEALTGEPGVFRTRIAYVSVTGSGEERRHRLMVADADGRNARAAVTSPEPIMSPAWSPDGRRLAYVSFEGGRSAVYVQRVATGERRRVSARSGINGAPAWAPDGRSLVVTRSADGDPDLYRVPLDGGDAVRLTDSSAIDTEAAFAPDGERLVFTSDRGGSPQLYTLTLSSGKVRRLTFEGGYNASADWRPDGGALTLVHRQDGKYRVAVMDPDGGSLRVVSEGGLDESPSFAPNGSMILYAASGGPRGVLRSVSSDGRARQTLSAGEAGVREPAWGPGAGSTGQARDDR